LLRGVAKKGPAIPCDEAEESLQVRHGLPLFAVGQGRLPVVIKGRLVLGHGFALLPLLDPVRDGNLLLFYSFL